jgi:hypothetical protein
MAHALKRPRVIPVTRPRLTRLALAYAVLALLVAGAGVAAYVLATQPAARAQTSTALAPAQTAGLGTYALKALAFQVQREYQQPGGTAALVAVVARPSAPPQFMTPSGPVAISALVVHAGFPIESPRDTKPYDVSKAAMFVMCGTGNDCAVPGTSSGLTLVLDREVLELTLRTLQKLSSTDSVLTFIPPASAKRVVYLTRAGLSKQLGEPLQKALAAPDLGQFMRARTFAVKGVNPLPDGSAFLEAVPGG